MDLSHQKTQSICLFGGTFDPIHLGHTYIAEKAARLHGLDKVIFLPCRQSPHKLGKESATDAHRLKMCQLATRNLAWAEVDDFDLLAPTPSYSWRTAEAMKDRFPEATLFWLMGADQWNNIHKWHRFEHLAKLVKFLVFTRGEIMQHQSCGDYKMIAGHHPASATKIRDHASSPLAKQWTDREVKYYLDSYQIYSQSLIQHK